MERYDFTKTGGFPFTQDVLKDMQEYYLTMMQKLCSNFGPGPFIISGMVQGGGSISSGWFYYNGDIIPFTGGTIPTPAGGSVVLVQITANTGTLTFTDGSTPIVKVGPTAVLTTGATVTDATHFPLSILQNFGREAAWNTLSITGVPSGISGTIIYRKNFIANTLQLQVSVTINSTALGTAYSGSIGTLPSGYRPTATLYYPGIINRSATTNIYDNQTPQAPIVAIPVWIDNTGIINIRAFISSPASIYTFTLNINMPLD